MSGLSTHLFAKPPCLSAFGSVASPQLVIDVEAVGRNVARMVGMVGGESRAARLRPHLKTHKSDVVTRMQLDLGIRDFKASTLGEVAMAAAAGADSVLLAHQAVGPKQHELVGLMEQFPNCRLSVIVDDIAVVRSLASVMSDRGLSMGVLIDIDCGMHRTGIRVGEELGQLIQLIRDMDSLTWEGFHVYDGHLHEPELDLRREGVRLILEDIITPLAEHQPATIVVGGTPTFGVWVEQSVGFDLPIDWQFSPGTCTLWDWGYGDAYPDLPFEIAAAVLTRVISLPGGSVDPSRQLVCLDLGHKAVASEMPLEERLRIVGWDDMRVVGQSEEHLVVSMPTDVEVIIGQMLWALPKHVCPTVSRYQYAAVVSPPNEAISMHPIEGRHL